MGWLAAYALFNVRRFDTIASWERAYDKDGVAGLMPQQPTRQEPMTPSAEPDLLPDSDGAALPSRQELLEEMETLRTENAYLKKLLALVQAQTKSAPNSGRKS